MCIRDRYQNVFQRTFSTNIGQTTCATRVLTYFIDHITPTLRDTLHWLPISQRITFKIALMVFDCSRGRCPKYFSDVYIPVHTMTARSRIASKISRPRGGGDLVVPRLLSRFGCCSFRVSGPTIWNDLPVDIRSTDITREQFKSWLFECACGRRLV